MDVKWVKIRSWHAVKPTDGFGELVVKTYCGRVSTAPTVDDLPAERSCETCLRIVARKADA